MWLGVHVAPPPRSDPRAMLLVVQMCCRRSWAARCPAVDLTCQKQQKATGAILSFATFACVTQTFWLGQCKFAKVCAQYKKSDLNCCVELTYISLLIRLMFKLLFIANTFKWSLLECCFHFELRNHLGGLDLQALKRSWTYAALHKVSSKADYYHGEGSLFMTARLCVSCRTYAFDTPMVNSSKLQNWKKEGGGGGGAKEKEEDANLIVKKKCLLENIPCWQSGPTAQE